MGFVCIQMKLTRYFFGRCNRTDQHSGTARTKNVCKRFLLDSGDEKESDAILCMELECNALFIFGREYSAKEKCARIECDSHFHAYSMLKIESIANYKEA